MSTVCGRDDRISAPIFGDGAGAAVLRAEPGNAGILRVLMRARGAPLFELPAGGPFDVGQAPRPPELCLRMKGAELFRAAVTELLNVTRELLRVCEIALDDVALLIPHQANRRMIDAMAEHLPLPPERVFCHIDRMGNLSGGSLPFALDEAWRSGRIRSGDLVLLNAVGGGLTWGAAALRL
jgi:3-oxoacyl-[acyl-carrier-protein] synthase-3